MSAAALLGTDWFIHMLSSFFLLEPLARAVIWGAAFCGSVVLLVASIARPSAIRAAAAKVWSRRS